MKGIFIASSFAAMFLLSGCGLIDNSIRGDGDLKEKAAFALGTTPDQITISNRKAEIDSVKFNATTKGKVYQCYYTTVGLSSDALCSATDGSKLPSGSQCNDSLKTCLTGG